jgi:hypothetical protein
MDMCKSALRTLRQTKEGYEANLDRVPKDLSMGRNPFNHLDYTHLLGYFRVDLQAFGHGLDQEA